MAKRYYTTTKSGEEVEAGGKDLTEGIRSLRKDFMKESKDLDKILQNTSILRNAYQIGEYRNSKGEVNRVASDQALIMTFNKILDPTSVVRESEFNRTPEAAGAMNRAVGWFAKLLEGGSGLTEAGRAAVYKMSEIIAQGALVDKLTKIEEYERIAGIGQVKPEQIGLIFPGFKGLEGDYAEFREIGSKAYIKKLVDDLNTQLDQVKNETIEGKHDKIDVAEYSFTNKRSKKKDKTEETVTPPASTASKPKGKRRKATKEDF